VKCCKVLWSCVKCSRVFVLFFVRFWKVVYSCVQFYRILFNCKKCCTIFMVLQSVASFVKLCRFFSLVKQLYSSLKMCRVVQLFVKLCLVVFIKKNKFVNVFEHLLYIFYNFVHFALSYKLCFVCANLCRLYVKFGKVFVFC
jgi:hypothetical protein